MNTKVLLLILFCLTSKHLSGQAKLRKMPPNINHTSINNYAPYISLDGNAMAYIADVAEDKGLTMNYTIRDGVNWRDPIILPKSINNRLNLLKGYALNADGKTLYLSNGKPSGLGGFDLYTSQLTGNLWSEPINMGLPINSISHEGCPSVSTDGNVMYFMRCDKMDFAKADGCKLMMIVKKSNGQWEQPVELPPYINTGNSQTPRIMGDGETLIFSSNKLQPTKGGMDLYITQFINGQWSKPRPLEFANTPGDDQFVSASSLGRYLLKDAPGQHNSELIEILFPPEVRPRGMMKVEGVVAGPVDPSSAFISVFNLSDQKKVFSARPGKDGTFIVYMKEGGLYDLSVEPEKDNFTFFSKIFDLTGDRFSALEKVSASLKAAATGDEISMDGISFKPYTAEINPASSQDLRRVTRMIQGNPEKSFSILVSLTGYQKDSVRSSADMTEILVDSIKIPVTYKVDSLHIATRDSVVIKTTYHNDRTPRQAKALGDYFIKQGIPAGRVMYTGKALPESIVENQKTTVKIIVR